MKGAPAGIRKIFWLILVPALGIGAYFALRRPAAAGEAAIHAAGARSTPAYDKYAYGSSDDARIIDVGTLPSAMYSSFASECLFHDRLLGRQLAASGWRLREHGFRDGDEMRMYMDGRLDVMFIGDISAFMAMQKRPIGIFAVSRMGYNSVIANRRLAPAELKGLRVGYPAGTTAHFAVENALLAGGLSLGDIVSVPLKMEEAEAALRGRAVDAVAVWEPYAATILGKVPESTVIANSESCTVVAVDLDFATRHPDLLRTVSAALLRAARWGSQDEDNLRSGLQWVREAHILFSGSSPVQADGSWAALLRRDTVGTPSFPLLPLDFGDERGFQRRKFEFLKKNGLIAPGAEWKSISDRVDTRLLPEIIREGRTWRLGDFDYSRDKLYMDEAPLR